MNIADNPTLKPYLGGIAYLQIRVSNTFGESLGMSEGMSYKFNSQH